MLRGEEEAYSAFFDRYFPALFRFASARVGGDADAAEEIVQATLCLAVRKVHTWRGEAALLTWLCTLCRHEVGSFLEKRGRRADSVSLTEDVPEVRAALESLAAMSSGPEAHALRAELARLVQSVLDALPDRYGDALEWKYALGLSVDEIASRLGTSPKAAESLLTRARAAFRDGYAAVSRGLKPDTPDRSLT
jgi:RNA polymerase sigma-70 factor (ECF subfamily)